MCGIVGYVGPRVAQDFLLEGLRRLEYRGYDSAGTATINSERQLNVTKSVGRIARLAQEVAASPCDSGIGIGHTRWATHGAATVDNAHPHLGGAETLAIAHNGVIENLRSSGQVLKPKAMNFIPKRTRKLSPTSSRTALVRSRIVQKFPRRQKLLSTRLRKRLDNCVELSGWQSFLNSGQIQFLLPALVARWLLVWGDGEHFLASDAQPLIGFTERIVYLADNQVAILTADSLEVTHRDAGLVSHHVRVLDVESNQVEMGGLRPLHA